MAKLIDIEQAETKKSRAIKTAIVAVSIMAVIVAAFLTYKVDMAGNNTEAAEESIGVHVKGAVENGGLYYVPYGTRINDLGKIAGGFKDNADLDGVNLAQYVKDGSEVYIPFKGSKENGGFNLNTVTREELLNNVSGIGETYAEKIISYRETVGSFTNVNELRSILGESLYEKVRERFYAE